jgi:tetratricopeptide (TPR) repeat protein
MPENDNKTEELLQKAFDLYDSGDYLSAVNSFDDLIKADPNFKRAWSNKGNALAELGRYEEALNSYDKAIEIDPKYAAAWYNKGNLFDQLMRYKESIECYDKAIEIDPKYAEAWNNKGWILDKLSKYDESLKCYSMAIKLYCERIKFHKNSDKPDYSTYADDLHNKAIALENQAEYNEAIKAYDEAITLKSRTKSPFADAWYNKGNSLYKLFAFDDAIKCFDKALEINPHYSNALNNKGVALYDLAKFDDALKCFDKALEINPRYAEAWNNKGNVLYELHKYDIAIDCYKIAVAENANYAEAWNNRAWLLANTKRNEEALPLNKMSLDIAPDDVGVLDTRGLIHYNLGKTDQAMDLFNEALGKYSRSESPVDNRKRKFAWYHKGVAQFGLKKYDESIRCYDKALSLDPDFAEALNDKGVALSCKENYDEAGDAVRKAIEIRPSFAIAHENLVRISLRIGKQQSFWDFWTISRSRKAVAIMLMVFALGIIIYYPIYSLYFGSQIIQTTKIINSASNSYKNSTTVTITSSKIPDTYFIIVGLVILILLSPILTRAKVGPLELEISQEPKRATPTLSLSTGPV